MAQLENTLEHVRRDDAERDIEVRLRIREANLPHLIDGSRVSFLALQEREDGAFNLFVRGGEQAHQATPDPVDVEDHPGLPGHVPDGESPLTEEQYDWLRELCFQVAGAATRPLMVDHPAYTFPSERVTGAIEHVLREFGIVRPAGAA